MYIVEIDNLIDNTLDLLIENIIMDKKKDIIDKIIKAKDFISYQKDINSIMEFIFELIDQKYIKTLVKKDTNIILINELIKKYCAIYFFIYLGINYVNPIKQFNNNIIEFSKLKNLIKIDDFYTTEVNSKIINSIILIKDLTGYYLKTLKKQTEKLEEFIKIYGLEKINKLEKFIIDVKDVQVRNHNLIKLIIFTNIYTIEEKKIIFDKIEDSENSIGDFIFIDVVISNPKGIYIDYYAIEKILSFEQNQVGMAKTIYKMINEDIVNEVEYSKNYYLNYDYKINKLIEYDIITPIVDDFLLYNKDNYVYEKKGNIEDKNKEDTKLKYIINKINLMRDYNQNKEAEALVYDKQIDKMSILYSVFENIKIFTSIKNFVKVKTELVNLYNDLYNYYLYPYVSFKDLGRDGFILIPTETFEVLRYISFNEKINKDNYLLTRSGSDNMNLNIVGFCLSNNFNKKLNELIDITYDENILQSIEEIITDKIKKKYNNTNKYFLFDLKKQIFGDYGQNNILDKYNDNLKMIISYLYDYFITETIKNINDNFNENRHKTIHYYMEELFQYTLNYPDILNINYVYKYFELIYKIYYKYSKLSNVDKYDYRNDLFYGINGDVIKVPSYNYRQIKFDNVLDLSTRYVKEKIAIVETDKNISRAICQHEIDWKKINFKNTNDFYEFNEKYVEISSNFKFICKSCKSEIEIKKYIIDGNYNSKTQDFQTLDINISSALDEMPEYSKFKGAIKNLDKIIDKMGMILNLQSIVGFDFSARSRRKLFIKNTIDIVTNQTNYSRKTNYNSSRNETLKKYGFNDFNMYSYSVFDFDNTIFVYSSKDEDLFKRQKYNTVMTHFIILLILDLNETQIYNLAVTKLFNFKSFLDVKDKVFKNFKIIINKSLDTKPILDYTILCYLIYIISGYVTLYNMWGIKEDKFSVAIHLSIINSIIEFLNLLLTVDADLMKKNNIYIYNILFLKYYSKLHFYSSKEEAKKLALHEKNEMKIKGTIVESSKHDFVINYYNILTYIEYKYATIRAFYLHLTAVKPIFNININKELLNMSIHFNCESGHFHQFNNNGECSLCKMNINDIRQKKIDFEINKIKNNYINNKLLELTKNYCLTGTHHIFNNNICIYCGYDKMANTHFTDKELLNLNNILNKKKKESSLKLNELIQTTKINNLDQAKIIEDNLTKIIRDFEKNNNDVSNTLNKLMDLIQHNLGVDIILNNKSINLFDNIYMIDYDIDGKKLKVPHLIKDNKENVKIIENHKFFNTTVIVFYIYTQVKLELYYNYNTKSLLGYKRPNKDIILVKQRPQCVYNVIYSVKDMILYYGFMSFNNNIADVYPEIFRIQSVDIENFKSNFSMNDYINKISKNRFLKILSLGRYLNIYLNRLSNNYKIKLLESKHFSKQSNIDNNELNVSYESSYFNTKLDILYYYSYNYFKKEKINLKNIKFFKEFNTLYNYLPFKTIDVENLKFNDNINANLILDRDNSSNLCLNYILNEIINIVSNNDKNIQKKLLIFILSIINIMFEETNYDIVYSNQSINYYKQLLYKDDIYTEIYNSHVINEMSDYYGILTTEEIDEMTEENKEIIDDEIMDDEELHGMMEEMGEGDMEIDDE